jgi:hypothetical protein
VPKATRAEFERRVQLVFEQLCKGASRASIMQHLADNGVSVCERQFANYMKEARTRLVETFKLSREEFVSEQLTALAHLAELATKDRQYSAAVGARAAIMRAVGADSPHR